MCGSGEMIVTKITPPVRFHNVTGQGAILYSHREGGYSLDAHSSSYESFFLFVSDQPDVGAWTLCVSAMDRM